MMIVRKYKKFRIMKLKIFWLQREGVHASELLRTRKVKDVVTTLKYKSLSQIILHKCFISS